MLQHQLMKVSHLLLTDSSGWYFVVVISSKREVLTAGCQQCLHLRNECVVTHIYDITFQGSFLEGIYNLCPSPNPWCPSFPHWSFVSLSFFLSYAGPHDEGYTFVLACNQHLTLLHEGEKILREFSKVSVTLSFLPSRRQLSHTWSNTDSPAAPPQRWRKCTRVGGWWNSSCPATPPGCPQSCSVSALVLSLSRPTAHPRGTPVGEGKW